MGVCLRPWGVESRCVGWSWWGGGVVGRVVAWVECRMSSGWGRTFIPITQPGRHPANHANTNNTSQCAAEFSRACASRNSTRRHVRRGNAVNVTRYGARRKDVHRHPPCHCHCRRPDSQRDSLRCNAPERERERARERERRRRTCVCACVCVCVWRETKAGQSMRQRRAPATGGARFAGRPTGRHVCAVLPCPIYRLRACGCNACGLQA